jgi:hypothetical protein
MNKKEAYKMGAEAKINNKPSAPALNQEFIKLACNSQTVTTNLLKAYNLGWHEKHIELTAIKLNS